MLIMGLQRRFEQANRPVTARVALPVQTVFRVDALARDLGLSRGEALAEAARDWVIRREGALGRDKRRRMESRMRAWFSADFPGEGLTPKRRTYTYLPSKERPRDGSTSGGRTPKAGSMSPESISPQVLSGAADNVPTVVLAPGIKGRRRAVGLSQQALAEAAGCSIQALRQYENGLTARNSSVLPKIEAALSSAESERSIIHVPSPTASRAGA